MLLSAILIVVILALVIGALLYFSQVKLRSQEDENPLVAQIDALLPQTQCGQCGYPGCRPYAEAIAKGEADINLCPPGGEQTVTALAELLHRDPLPLAKEESLDKIVAYIDESKCIGCVLCIKACPVDSIIGATKQMHTIIAHECTGCTLCVPVCPVDCIEMIPAYSPLIRWNWSKPESIDANV